MAESERRKGRGLDEVLNHYIDEDEQAEARARAGAEQPRQPDAARPTRPPSLPWCFAAQPGRPLSCALALDLARALSAPDPDAQLLATFPVHPLLASHARGAWHTLESDDGGPPLAALARNLRPDVALLALTPAELASLLPQLTPGAVAGAILPVDSSSRGLAQALAVLRSLPRPGPWFRIAVLCLGTNGSGDQAVFRKLDGAARRQLGIGLEPLGALPRDRADDRSLLTGVSVLDSEPGAPSALALLRVRERLQDGHASAHA